MSMIQVLRAIPPETLGKIKKDPRLTRYILFSDHDPEAVAALENAEYKMNQEDVPALYKIFFKMFPWLRKKIEDDFNKKIKQSVHMIKQKPETKDIDTGEEMDLDKAWHGIHYLLTGKPGVAEPPLGDAIMGGVEIGEDTGYGKPRFLEPQQVKAVADALSKISPDELLQCYDKDELNKEEIYGVGYDEKQDRDYLSNAYREMVDFYQKAALNGRAMLFYLT